MPAGAVQLPPVGTPRSTRSYLRWANRATAARSARTVAAHWLPAQAPSNPTKRDSASAVADNVSAVPSGKLASHAPGQSIPPGVETTRPMPAPAGVTATLKEGTVWNDAATWTPAVRVSEHAPPPQPSEKPVKVAPDAAVAIRVTALFGANAAEQT